MRSSRLCPIAVVIIVAAGCQTSQPPQSFQWRQWGAMREVLRNGESQPRVHLADVLTTPHAYGVGALAHLAGEVTIIDGTVWIARADRQEAISTRTTNPTESATLLAVAHVPQWQTIEVPTIVGDAQLESFIRQSAIGAGIDPDHPFPFLITGIQSAEGHIIRGSCPHASIESLTDPDAQRPYRFTIPGTDATAIGIYAESSQGELTHHGSKTHIHVVVEGDALLSGHVDSIKVLPGAWLRVPKASAP